MHPKDLVHLKCSLSRFNALQLVMVADSDLQATSLVDAELSPDNFRQTWLHMRGHMRHSFLHQTR